jgi:hypothetical protein
MSSAATPELGASHLTARKRRGWDSAAAARTNAYRARRRAGRIVVNLEIDAEDVSTLVEAQLLDGRQNFHGRKAIGQAVKEFLRLARYA